VTLYTTPTAESPKAANWVRDSVVTDGMHGKRPADQVKMAAWSPDGKWLALTANWGQDFYHLWLVGVEDGVVTGRPQPIRKIQACEISWRFDSAELVFTERDNECEQAGTVKRADYRKPAEQTSIEIGGAADPTWAGGLSPEALAAAGDAAGGGADSADAGDGEDGNAPADAGDAGDSGEPVVG
jgi:dipeptidyl aminopeptidase/acylaminoacyl peptidase